MFYQIRFYKNFRAGMTLIEILISISILVLMAAILSPQLFNFYERQNLKDDTSKVAFALKNARDKAINGENNSPWGVHFVNTGSAADYFIVFSGADFSGGQLQPPVALNNDVHFVVPGAGLTQDVTFSKISGLPTSASNIIISLKDDSAASSTINVSALGEVRY